MYKYCQVELFKFLFNVLEWMIFNLNPCLVILMYTKDL